MVLNIKKKYKIYLHIRSFFNYYLKRDLKSLFFFLHKNKLIFFKRRIIYLPSRLKKFSVVRSPFVSKLSKEQFEIKIYRIVIILDYNTNLFSRFARDCCWNNLHLKFSYFKIIFFYFNNPCKKNV